MKRIIFTVLLLGSMVSASANEVYVSASGNDSNDGASAATAYATFGKALTAVEANGTIHISGMLYACDDPANALPDGDINKGGYVINKSITVQGDNKATSGLIGFSEITYEAGRFFRVDAGGTLTLKNLTLKDGTGTQKGGAVFVNGGTLIAENVIFQANEATGDNQPAGGAVQVDRTLGVSFKKCLFKSNKAAKGGAFYIQDTQNTGVELRFEACSFIGNQSTQGGASCGGLFFRLISETPTINIINCTFSGNINGGNGGTVYVYGAPASATFNIINTTIVDNIGRSGGGSGAGVNVEVQTDELRKPVLRIQNSIIEGNAVSDGATAEDLVFGYEPTVSQLQVSNSFIGKVWVAGAGTIPADAYAETAYWDYLTRTFDRTELLSGIDAFSSEYNVYPLTASSLALTYGKASFLQAIGINADQLGTVRAFADGKCSAGAMEGVGIPAGLGLDAVKLQGAIKIAQSDGLLAIGAAGTEKISVDLISVSGQTIVKKSGIGQLDIPVGQLKGVYVAKVIVAGEVYTQKIIIQ
jgi:hypothetical protein